MFRKSECFILNGIVGPDQVHGVVGTPEGVVGSDPSNQFYLGQFLASFQEFPPSQKAGSFSLDAVLPSLQSAGGNGN